MGYSLQYSFLTSPSPRNLLRYSRSTTMACSYSLQYSSLTSPSPSFSPRNLLRYSRSTTMSLFSSGGLMPRASGNNGQEAEERDYTGTPKVPVFVMLPLGTIGMDGKLVGAEDLQKQLNSLKDIGTEGVMVDCWWGLVEPEPQKYKWEGYRSLFDLVRSVNLKLQVVMSFHECGGNVGDDVHIPLPRWILEIGRENQDIFFTDKENRRNEECLSWGVDFQPVLDGRTAIKVYEDFMKSFHSEFDDLLQGGDITEIEVGMGPCGELRYPSYPSKHGWTYPGIGEFQCYDKYMLESLKSDAELMGVKDWENPPSNVGSYNSRAEDTGFFCDGGGYDSFHGRFFLKWYSSLLIAHGNDMLETAKEVFTATPIAVKLSGIHWWFKTFSHAAELTAGFYNPSTRDGYSPIASMVKKNKATLNFTCVELRTEDQNREFSFAFPDPEGLVWQVLNVAWDVGIYCLAILGKDTIKFWKLQSRLVIHWEDNYLALPI